MGTFKSYDLHIVTDGRVKRTGGSAALGRGEVAIANASELATKQGMVLVDDFASLKAKDRLEILIGAPDLDPSRSISNKSRKIPYSFSLNDIVDLRVDAPAVEGIPSVDDQVIGFNGTDGTEITLAAGETKIIQLGLTGASMGYLGYPQGETFVEVVLQQDNAGSKTNQEIVETAVEELKGYLLAGQTPLSNYVDIIPVNSENADITGDNAVAYFSLEAFDDGSFIALSRVRAQYPSLDIQRVSFNEADSVSTYEAATGSQPAAFAAKTFDKLPSCATCPAGYTLVGGGVVYNITVEDSGGDYSENGTGEGRFDEIPGYVRDVKLADDLYEVVLDDALTGGEITTYQALDGVTGATTIVLTDAVYADVCTPPAGATTAWSSSAVRTCYTSTQDFDLLLPDTECGTSRLAELQAAYPDLTISEVGSSDDFCRRIYRTSIATKEVCEECDVIYQDFYTVDEADKPSDYDQHPWTTAEKSYSASAKMGIRFRAKEQIFGGDEEYRDEIPFIYEATRLSLVGGFPTMRNLSYNVADEDRMNVTLLSRYQPPKNLGGHMRIFEDQSMSWFEDKHRHYGNNYAKTVFGERTLLDATRQYVDIALTIQTDRTVSMPTQAQRQKITYHFIAAVGDHEPVENMLNDLAAAAGIDPVVVYN